MYKRFIILICFVSVLFSCRQETIFPDEQESAITQMSEIATLIERISLNDGSSDNIIDGANCITIEFPYSVTINGELVNIQNEDDYDDIEDILQESIINEILINFPITIRNANQTTTIIANQTEFDILSDMCNGENEVDDDIECLDFVYPITFSIFNTVTEQISTIIVQNDNQLYNVIEMLDENEIANVQFPISLIFSDGSSTTVDNLDELESLIDNSQDSCDEDDDFDYEDDNCQNCDLTELENVLIGCTNWFVDDFKFNGDHTEDFEDFSFDFLINNELSITNEAGVTFMGNWYVTAVNDEIKLTFLILDFPEFNLIWDLDDIQIKESESKIKLKFDKDNHLRFENECGKEDVK